MEPFLIQIYFIALVLALVYFVYESFRSGGMDGGPTRAEVKQEEFRKRLKLALKDEQSLYIELGDEHTHVFSNDDAIYWHFARMKGAYGTTTWGKRFGIYRDLLERLSPDDLLVIARSDLSDDQMSPNKTTDLNVLAALEKLDRRGEWRHLSYVSPAVSEKAPVRWQITGNRGLEESYLVERLRNATNHQPAREILYCEKHLHRFDKVSSNEVDYAACRKCRGTQYGITVKKSILVLSRSIGWATRKEGDSFWINGLLLEEPCDFDEIAIGPYSYEELERFCIMIGNDADTWRVKKYPDMYYRLMPEATVTEEGESLLNRFFSRM